MAKSIIIDRDTLKEQIIKICGAQYEKFEVSDLKKIGNQYRCTINIDGKISMLDFYFNKNGSTTISVVGKNIEISSFVKTQLETAKTSSVAEAKTYSFKDISKKFSSSLIQYLTQLQHITMSEKKNKLSNIYSFVDTVGDKLTVTIFTNGTVLLQGFPAHLYTEAISFMSYSDDVSIEQVVEATNAFHEKNIEPDTIYSDLKKAMPYAYNKIDGTIIKLITPALSMRRMCLELEDYSCCAFPALRGLEGYIKYLFKLNDIAIGDSFGPMFCKGHLSERAKREINNTKKIVEMDKAVIYFGKHRHVLFHTEQALEATHILENQVEANEIVSDVLGLIDETYKNADWEH